MLLNAPNMQYMLVNSLGNCNVIWKQNGATGKNISKGVNIPDGAQISTCVNYYVYPQNMSTL